MFSSSRNDLTYILLNSGIVRNELEENYSILVAVDGSAPSFRAADYAMKLAVSYGAKLSLITVTYMPAKYHSNCIVSLLENSPYCKRSDDESRVEGETERDG
ncbi:MAG: universal stress protein [Nitrososphaeraceae archaeon]